MKLQKWEKCSSANKRLIKLGDQSISNNKCHILKKLTQVWTHREQQGLPTYRKVYS